MGLPPDHVAVLIDPAARTAFHAGAPGTNLAGMDVASYPPPVAAALQGGLFRGIVSTSLLGDDRAGAARARREGLGLGLYIAKGLVEAHGGRIGVESNQRDFL